MHVKEYFSLNIIKKYLIHHILMNLDGTGNDVNHIHGPYKILYHQLASNYNYIRKIVILISCFLVAF